MTQHDPFTDCPDPASYVPRPASEGALAELLHCASHPNRPALLLAPPGLGKSLLLHLLATRLPPLLRSVYVPNAALSPVDLCTWTLGRLGAGDWPDPIPVLAAFTEHCAGRGGALVWLVDDAHDLPEETARWIGRLRVQSRGALRLVATAVEDERAKVLEALGPLRSVRTLARPMSVAESRSYVRARLAQAALDPQRRSEIEEALERIQKASGGVPRALSSAASLLLAGRDAPL